MAFIRSLAVIMLALTLLPWGAYSAAKAAEQPVSHTQPLAAADPCHAGDLVGAQPTDSRAAALPRQCRTGILVGSPCGPDLAVFGSETVTEMTRARHIRFPETTARLVSVTLTRALDPPISC